MKILITNDDGINAPGLLAAEKIARELSDDILVVAPETDQSGLAHSLTLSHPLRLRKVDENKFAINGTPTDCVIMGVREILDTPPDLILSGVNTGQNIADDITYSGTVAGAVEGALLGIKSIALSQAYNYSTGSRTVQWETCEALAPSIIRKLIECEFPSKTLVNVNFPDCRADEIVDTVMTNQGAFTHGLFMEKRHDGRGLPYYWIKFGRDVAPNQHDEADIVALQGKKISVTPLKLDLTDFEFKQKLSNLF